MLCSEGVRRTDYCVPLGIANSQILLNSSSNPYSEALSQSKERLEELFAIHTALWVPGTLYFLQKCPRTKANAQAQLFCF